MLDPSKTDPRARIAQSVSGPARGRLEVYESMPHVFQALLADTPEGEAAWAEMAAFWTEHLAS